MPEPLTWDKLEEIGLGELRMTFTEMYDLTPRSFFNAVNGARKKEDSFSKERWLMTRELMFATLAPYLEKGIEKQDILPFEWEQNQIKALSEQKEKELLDGIEKVVGYWDRYDNAQKEGC